MSPQILSICSIIVSAIAIVLSFLANKKTLSFEEKYRKREQEFSLLSNRIATRQKDIASSDLLTSQRDLSLSAYSQAIDRLLDLKADFAEQEIVFKEQMEKAGYMQVIPDSMKDDIPQFLLFASAMWKFSYVYSVTRRWEDFGWTENEKTGLENEIKLWLSLPGFYEVYCSHVRALRVHNPDYLAFLEALYQEKDQAEDFSDSS